MPAMRYSVVKHARWWIRELLQQWARLKCPKTAATCRLLTRHEPSLWVLPYHEGVEPADHEAEQALRSPVISRKINLGNGTESGARCTERLPDITEACPRIGRCTRTLVTGSLVAYRQGRLPLPFFPALPRDASDQPDPPIPMDRYPRRPTAPRSLLRPPVCPREQLPALGPP